MEEIAKLKVYSEKEIEEMNICELRKKFIELQDIAIEGNDIITSMFNILKEG